MFLIIRQPSDSEISRIYLICLNFEHKSGDLQLIYGKIIARSHSKINLLGNYSIRIDIKIC